MIPMICESERGIKLILFLPQNLSSSWHGKDYHFTLLRSIMYLCLQLDDPEMGLEPNTDILTRSCTQIISDSACDSNPNILGINIRCGGGVARSAPKFKDELTWT